MTTGWKRLAKALGGRRIAMEGRRLATRMGARSWSQEGEDRILARFFERHDPGFYVDVGAHHPWRFSNTALLHSRGWHGINIDALPGSMAPFRRARPGDVNLEVGVAEAAGQARFFVFNEPALNTFDAETAKKHSTGQWRVEREVEVPLLPLRDILARHLPEGRKIDLLTVDAEGRDLQVLRSNDWERFRPRVVLAESLGQTLDTLADDPCAQFLRQQGYGVFAKTVNTVMYLDQGEGGAG